MNLIIPRFACTNKMNSNNDVEKPDENILESLFLCYPVLKYCSTYCMFKSTSLSFSKSHFIRFHTMIMSFFTRLLRWNDDFGQSINHFTYTCCFSPSLHSTWNRLNPYLHSVIHSIWHTMVRKKKNRTKKSHHVPHTSGATCPLPSKEKREEKKITYVFLWPQAQSRFSPTPLQEVLKSFGTAEALIQRQCDR